MVFYDSYYKAAAALPQSERKKLLVAILDYYFTSEEPKLRSSTKAVFEVCRPTLNKSRSCKERGAKGGLALQQKFKQKEKEKEKETPTCVGVQKIAAQQVAPLAPSRSPSPVSGLVSVSGVGDTPSLQETIAVATGVMGVSEEFARWWHGEMTARDWTNTDGSTIGRRNWRPVLKAWWNNRRDGEMREINEAARASKERERVYSPADWGLCRERCAKCGEHGCTAGAKVPPQFWAPPQQPEQCPRFRSI